MVKQACRALGATFLISHSELTGPGNPSLPRATLEQCRSAHSPAASCCRARATVPLVSFTLRSRSARPLSQASLSAHTTGAGALGIVASSNVVTHLSCCLVRARERTRPTTSGLVMTAAVGGGGRGCWFGRSDGTLSPRPSGLLNTTSK